MPSGKILWGTNYENELPFSYPTSLDDQRSFRRAAPGSQFRRNAAGVADAWITGRDYFLAGRARWFSAQKWGGLGLQDFLDYAADGNAFRFIPDDRYPTFYVDSCYLESPREAPEPDLEQTDGSQSIDLLIRNRAFDFTLARRGLMFEYVPGKSLTDLGGTFARADATTCATYIDRNGVVRTVAANVPRDAHFIGGVRHLLFEPTSANLCLQSCNFGTTWAAVGTPSRSAAAHTASGITLDLIGDDDGAALEGYTQTITFTADAVKAVSVVVKQGSSTSTMIRLRDTTAGADRLLAAITWSGSVPVITMTTGTSRGYIALADGAYRILLSTTSVTAANTNSIQFYPASDAALGTTATGTVYAGGVQAENQLFPTSFILTTTGTVTRAADTLYFSYSPVPQAMTVYCKFVERGTILMANETRVWAITANPLAAGALRSDVSGNKYRTRSIMTPGGAESVMTTAPSYGDTVELRSTLSSTGVTQCNQSINAAAETSATASAANALNAGWSGPLLHVGGIGGSNNGCMALQSLRIMAGVRTQSEIQAA